MLTERKLATHSPLRFHGLLHVVIFQLSYQIRFRNYSWSCDPFALWSSGAVDRGTDSRGWLQVAVDSGLLQADHNAGVQKVSSYPWEG